MSRHFGFTLLELMLSLCLMAILSFFSYSSLLTLYRKNELEVLINEVKATIVFSKNQSILRSQNLVLSPLPGSNEWADGMLLFVDNKEHRYHSGIKIVHEWHWNRNNIHLQWHGFRSNTYLIFSRDLRKSSCNGHFEITSPSHSPMKLWLNRLGRVRD